MAVGARRFLRGDRVLGDVAWIGLPQGGPTTYCPLDAGSAGPVFMARLGGGICPAVDVHGLIE